MEVIEAVEQAKMTAYLVQETLERIEELSNGKTRSAGTETRERIVQVSVPRPAEAFPIDASLAEGLAATSQHVVHRSPIPWCL